MARKSGRSRAESMDVVPWIFVEVLLSAPPGPCRRKAAAVSCRVRVSSWSLELGAATGADSGNTGSRVTSLSFSRAACRLRNLSSVSCYWLSLSRINRKKTIRKNIVQFLFVFPFGGETVEEKEKKGVLLTHPESRRTKPSRAESPAAFLSDFKAPPPGSPLRVRAVGSARQQTGRWNAWGSSLLVRTLRRGGLSDSVALTLTPCCFPPVLSSPCRGVELRCCNPEPIVRQNEHTRFRYDWGVVTTGGRSLLFVFFF